MSEKTESVVKKGGDPLNQVIIRPVSTTISAALFRTPVTPNQVSVFALLLAVIASVLIATATGLFDRVIAAVLLYFYLVFDCVDGELARRKRVASPYGQWLDGMVDTLATSLLLASLAYAALAQSGMSAWLWGFAAVIGFNAANFSYQYGQLVFAPPKGPARRVGLHPLRLLLGFSPSLQMLVIAAGAVFSPLLAVAAFALWSNLLWLGRAVKYRRMHGVQ